MTIRHVMPGLLASLLCACAAQGQLSNANLQKISLCSGGHRQTLSADVEAKLAQDLRTGGHVSATLSSEIKGMFLADQNIPASDRLKAYEDYIACVEHI